MKFEQPPMEESKAEHEEAPIALTSEEYEALGRPHNQEDPNVHRLMAEKGIAFDTGDIVVDIDGEKKMVTTNKDDFFTRLTNQTIEERYGKEKLKSLQNS